MGNLWVSSSKKVVVWASTRSGCQCCQGGTSQCFSAHQPHQSETSWRRTSLHFRLGHMLYFIHLQWISFGEGAHWFEFQLGTSGRSGRCNLGHQERLYPFALGINWAFFSSRKVSDCLTTNFTGVCWISWAVIQGLALCFSPWSPQTLILLPARRWFGLGERKINLKLFWEKINLPGPDSAIASCNQGLVWNSLLFECRQRHGYCQLWSYPVEHPRCRTPKKRCSLSHLFINILRFCPYMFWDVVHVSFFLTTSIIDTKVMKLSQRFELLIAERRVQEAARHQTDGEILQDLVSKYNQFKANSALKKWQISPDQLAAILGVIEGMTFESRQLVRAHLDFNKYEESGYLIATYSLFYLIIWGFYGQIQSFAEKDFWVYLTWWVSICFPSTGYNEFLLRCKRHQLHESPKGTTGFWKDRLTATWLIWTEVLFYSSFSSCERLLFFKFYA